MTKRFLALFPVVLLFVRRNVDAKPIEIKVRLTPQPPAKPRPSVSETKKMGIIYLSSQPPKRYFEIFKQNLNIGFGESSKSFPKKSPG